MPLNVNHRLVNATSSPALLIAFTTATPLMAAFPNRRFIFENPFEFTERFDESEDYFKPKDKILAKVAADMIKHCFCASARFRSLGNQPY